MIGRLEYIIIVAKPRIWKRTSGWLSVRPNSNLLWNCWHKEMHEPLIVHLLTTSVNCSFISETLFSTPGLLQVKIMQHKIQSIWEPYRIPVFAPQHVTIITNRTPSACNQTFFSWFPSYLWEFRLKPWLQHRPRLKLRSVKNEICHFWYLSFLPSSIIPNQISKACLQAAGCCWGACCHCRIPPLRLLFSESGKLTKWGL